MLLCVVLVGVDKWRILSFNLEDLLEICLLGESQHTRILIKAQFT